ncbi:hypothetical protein [Modestobacter altitudinis]|uniref:hypothetical protein n=1 Tax=Modestobacter altitudinis TaxID=2213158 RepID=UPI0014873B38|nr:hypothetical protein [Modestobacter altitudinis]
MTVLLGAPPGWRGSDPTVVPLVRRNVPGPVPVEHRPAAASAADATSPVAHGGGSAAVGDAPGGVRAGGDVAHIDTAAADPWSVVDLDEVERRAVQALADFGLVPPLRHQDASTSGDRHVS